VNKLVEKISAVILLSRPINLLISFLSVLGGIYLAWNEKGEFPIDISFFAGISVVFVTAASNIINDFFDLEIDRINRPKRGIPAGKISSNEAIYYYIFFVAISILFSLFLNWQAQVIVVFANIILFFYSLKLKGLPVLGNFIVAFFTGFVFIFSAILVGNWQNGIIPFVFAFQINFIREMIKDYQDILGDEANNLRTLPILIGEKNTKILVAILSFILISTTTLPYFFDYLTINYFVIVFATTNLFVAKSTVILFEKDVNFKKISFYLKLGMLFGLLAIIEGKY